MSIQGYNANVASNGRAQRLHVGPVAQQATSTVGRMMGTTVRQSLSARALAKDALMGGVSNIPFDGLFNSQAYRRGDLKANEYAARILGNSVSFGAWTVGGALAGVALAPLGLPAVAVGILGFAAGMTSQDLFDRTVGHKFTKYLATVIDEKSVKPVADVFTKYVANPLNDYLWRPVVDTIKGHKVLAAGVAGVLALKFPGAAKVIATEGGKMAGGMAVGMAINLGVVERALGPSQIPFEKAPATEGPQVDAKWIKTFNEARTRLESRGATPEAALEGAYRFFVQTMVSNGATQADAEALVTEIAKAATTTPAPKTTGKTVPAGLLMAR